MKTWKMALLCALAVFAGLAFGAWGATRRIKGSTLDDILYTI